MPPGKPSPLGRRTQSLLGTEFSVVKHSTLGGWNPGATGGLGRACRLRTQAQEGPARPEAHGFQSEALVLLPSQGRPSPGPPDAHGG